MKTCEFCDQPTEDSAHLVLRRGKEDERKNVDINYMGIWCCYECFYKKLTKQMMEDDYASELIEKAKERK